MGSFYGLQAACSAAEFQHALALQAIAEFLRQLSMALMPSIRRVNVLHERRVNFVKILVKPTVHGPHTSSCWLPVAAKTLRAFETQRKTMNLTTSANHFSGHQSLVVLQRRSKPSNRSH